MLTNEAKALTPPTCHTEIKERCPFLYGSFCSLLLAPFITPHPRSRRAPLRPLTCYLFLPPLPSLLVLPLKWLLSPHPFLGDLTYFQPFTPPLGIDVQVPIAVPDSKFAPRGSGGHLCGTMSNTDLHLASVFLLEFPSQHRHLADCSSQKLRVAAHSFSPVARL